MALVAPVNGQSPIDASSVAQLVNVLNGTDTTTAITAGGPWTFSSSTTTVFSHGATISAGGLQVTAGNVGLGGAPIGYAYLASGSALGVPYASTFTSADGSGNQVGFMFEVKGTSAGTGAMIALETRAFSAATSYTVASLWGVYVGQNTKGAGSTVTTNAGIYIDPQTAGNTNNYGIYVNAPSGGSGKNEYAKFTDGTRGLDFAAVSDLANYTLISFNQNITNAGHTGIMSAGGSGDKNLYISAESTAQIVMRIAGTSTFWFGPGVQVGAAPTGGDKGAGTINVATGIYLNGAAYTNPHGGFEAAYTGKVERYAERMAAMGLPDYAHWSIDRLEAYTREHFHFPYFEDAVNNDIFAGGERHLLMTELLATYTFDHESRIKALEARLGSV